jgi:Protein of unknown function (DUF1573)
MKPFFFALLALLSASVAGPFAVSADALHFTSPTQELSATEDAVDIHASYVFTNSSDHEITISEIKTSCGCTTAELERRTYQAGESGTINVVFDIGSRTGEQQKSIAIISSTGEQTMLMLKIHLPPGPTFSSTIVSWRQGTQPEPRVISIKLPKEHSYKLTEATVSDETFTATLKPGNENNLVDLTILPSSTERAFNATIDVHTSNAKTFTIFANIIPTQPITKP